jgi:hypothetical protein
MNLKSIRNHEYIKLIEYALSNNEFSAEEASAEIGITTEQFRFARDSIFNLNPVQSSGAEFRTSHKYKWHLSPQDYFNYLQYLEFIHATNSAKKANWIAIIAIIFSGLLALTQIILTVIQLTKV